jgi:hypothetical protein
LRNLTEISAIPDSVVDNFEDAGGEPAGVYETGQTIADYYDGATSDWGRTTTEAVEGDKALESTTADSPLSIYSRPGEGLNQYPTEGDTIDVLWRTGGFSTEILTNVETGSTPGGYAFNVRDSEITIRKRSDLSNLSDETVLAGPSSISLSTNAWYYAEIDLPTTADGSMALRVFDVDTNDLSKGSQQESLSATDTEFSAEEGIGVARRSGSGTGTVIDRVRVL